MLYDSLRSLVESQVVYTAKLWAVILPSRWQSREGSIYTSNCNAFHNEDCQVPFLGVYRFQMIWESHVTYFQALVLSTSRIPKGRVTSNCLPALVCSCSRLTSVYLTSSLSCVLNPNLLICPATQHNQFSIILLLNAVQWGRLNLLSKVGAAFFAQGESVEPAVGRLIVPWPQAELRKIGVSGKASSAAPLHG